LVVKAYREAVAALARPEVKYTEWDFHGECRGMKYENIAKLLDERAEDIEHIRYVSIDCAAVVLILCGEQLLLVSRLPKAAAPDWGVQDELHGLSR
jgi:hypothetical protein